MKRKRNALPRKEDAIAIQNLLREASNIKREIAAKMAREGVVIAELKELNSTVVPRHIKLGHDTPEGTLLTPLPTEVFDPGIGVQVAHRLLFFSYVQR